MVGAAAGAAGGAALRTTMVIGARLGAIRQFGAMQGAMGLLNNRMVQTGLGVANLVGSLSLLGGVAGILANPITGLLGLLATALSAKEYKEYEDNVRRARIQLGLLTDFKGDIDEFVKTIDNWAGKDASKDLWENSEAVRAVALAYQEDRGMLKSMVEIAEFMERDYDMNFGTALGLLADASNDEAGPAFKELASIFGMKNEDGSLNSNITNFTELLPELIRLVDELPEAATKIEELVDKEGELLSRWGYRIQPFTEFMASLGVIKAKVALALDDSAADLVTGYRTAFDTKSDSLSTIGIGIADTILFTMAGQWDRIGPMWQDEIIPKLEENMENLVSAMLKIGEGFGLDWLTQRRSDGELWDEEWTLRGGLIMDSLKRVFTDDEFSWRDLGSQFANWMFSDWIDKANAIIRFLNWSSIGGTHFPEISQSDNRMEGPIQPSNARGAYTPSPTGVDFTQPVRLIIDEKTFNAMVGQAEIGLYEVSGLAVNGVGSPGGDDGG